MINLTVKAIKTVNKVNVKQSSVTETVTEIVKDSSIIVLITSVSLTLIRDQVRISKSL